MKRCVTVMTVFALAAAACGSDDSDDATAAAGSGGDIEAFRELATTSDGGVYLVLPEAGL